MYHPVEGIGLELRPVDFSISSCIFLVLSQNSVSHSNIALISLPHGSESLDQGAHCANRGLIDLICLGLWI